MLLARAARDEALVHLFDEPQLNTQDGYIGFMLRFFENLRRRDRLLFVCLHPQEPWQLELLREIAESFVFVERGQVTRHRNVRGLDTSAGCARLSRASGRRKIAVALRNGAVMGKSETALADITHWIAGARVGGAPRSNRPGVQPGHRRRHRVGAVGRRGDGRRRGQCRACVRCPHGARRRRRIARA